MTGCEISYKPQCQCILALCQALKPALEKWFFRPVATVLQTRKQSVRPFVFARRCKAVQSLSLPGDKALAIVVVFVSQRERGVLTRLHPACHAHGQPLGSARSERLILPAIVEVGIEAHPRVGVDVEHR